MFVWFAYKFPAPGETNKKRSQRRLDVRLTFLQRPIILPGGLGDAKKGVTIREKKNRRKESDLCQKGGSESA